VASIVFFRFAPSSCRTGQNHIAGVAYGRQHASMISCSSQLGMGIQLNATSWRD
jgi:hypothetical protein